MRTFFGPARKWQSEIISRQLYMRDEIFRDVMPHVVDEPMAVAMEDGSIVSYAVILQSRNQAWWDTVPNREVYGLIGTYTRTDLRKQGLGGAVVTRLGKGLKKGLIPRGHVLVCESDIVNFVRKRIPGVDVQSRFVDER